MKQKIYKISCCFVAAFLVICSFSVPSFAFEFSSDFSGQPIDYYFGDTIPTRAALSSSGYSVWSNDSSTDFYYLGAGNSPIYTFCYPYSSSAYQIAVCSETDDFFYHGWYSTSTRYYATKLNYSSSSSDYNLYYVSGINTTFDSGIFSCPAFASLDEGLAAVRYYIDNGGGSVEPSLSGDYLLEIPKGTVAYIGVPSNGTLVMSGTKVMPIDSNLFGAPWPNDPTRVQVVSSRPSTGENIENVNSGSMPNWFKDDKYHNMWGQTDKAFFGPSNWTFDDGSGFLKIYNPFYYGAAGSSNIGGGSFVDNNSLFVTISGYSSIRLYSVKDTIGSTGIVGSVDTPDQYWDKDLTDSDEDGVPDNNSWTSSDPGMSSTPDNSQLNQPSVVESISGYLNTITSTLSNFANNIIDLIQAPISHIGQLIDAGSGFMSGLHGLYAWLPSDVQGYITSALSLVVCIGVFKVFL